MVAMRQSARHRRSSCGLLCEFAPALDWVGGLPLDARGGGESRCQLATADPMVAGDKVPIESFADQRVPGREDERGDDQWWMASSPLVS